MTDLALWVMKVTVWSFVQRLSMLVIQECHLWLNLAEMKEFDKVRFLDAPISLAGLFGYAVENFVHHLSAVQKQTEAIKHILPWRECCCQLSSIFIQATTPSPPQEGYVARLSTCQTIQMVSKAAPRWATQR